MRHLRVRSGGAPRGRAGRRPARDRRGRAGHEPRLAQPRPRLARPRDHGLELRDDRGARGRRAAGAGALVRRAPLGRPARGAGRPLLALRRDGRAGAHRPAGERRGGILRPGRAREPRLGGAGLPPLRRDPRQRGRGAPRRLPHVRHSLPVVGGGRAGAARPREGQVHRRPRERAGLACRGAPLVPPLRRSPGADRPTPGGGEPPLRPHPAPRRDPPGPSPSASRRSASAARPATRSRWSSSPGTAGASCPGCSR